MSEDLIGDHIDTRSVRVAITLSGALAEVQWQCPVCKALFTEARKVAECIRHAFCPRCNEKVVRLKTSPKNMI